MTGAHAHIGVIGALPEEVDRLHELLTDETITAEHVGRAVTGNEFIHGDLNEVVRSRAPDAICVDMEGATVAQVCLEHGSVPLCVIRSISDLASGTASIDFPLFLDTLARHYAAEILTRMFAAPLSVGPGR